MTLTQLLFDAVDKLRSGKNIYSVADLEGILFEAAVCLSDEKHAYTTGYMEGYTKGATDEYDS